MKMPLKPASALSLYRIDSGECDQLIPTTSLTEESKSAEDASSDPSDIDILPLDISFTASNTSQRSSGISTISTESYRDSQFEALLEIISYALLLPVPACCPHYVACPLQVTLVFEFCFIRNIDK